MITHMHHINPRHMGGSDDPSNLIELTIPQHAEEHRLLFEKHGHWQDEIAYKCLIGQITNAEATRLAGIAANTGKKTSEETKRKLSENSSWLGKTRPEHSKFMKDNNPKYWLGKKNDEQSIRMSGENGLNFGKRWKQEIVTCPHCGKSGGISAMKRHHFDNCKNKLGNNK